MALVRERTILKPTINKVKHYISKFLTSNYDL